MLCELRRIRKGQRDAIVLCRGRRRFLTRGADGDYLKLWKRLERRHMGD
jgi:hypothetical protein